MKLRKGNQTTTNFKKHTTKNPLGKIFLNNFLKTVVATVRPLQITTVLDVGCGEGFTLARLKKVHIGKVYEGIEKDLVAIELGKKLYPKVTIKEGDIYKLPYKSNSFDLVMATEVLEHLDNPKKAYRELLRVSKKYVLLSVPNEPWFTFQRIARFQNILHLGAHPEHIQHWTSRGFSKFVKVKGVKVIDKKLPTPWTMILLRKDKG